FAGGQSQMLFPRRRGGVARSDGVAGVRRRTTRPRHCRVLPSFSGGQRQMLSPPRRGGVARSDGVVGFDAAGPPVRDTVASCPPRRGGQSQTRSPPRRGGVARSDGVVGFGVVEFGAPQTTRPRHCRVLPSLSGGP